MLLSRRKNYRIIAVAIIALSATFVTSAAAFGQSDCNCGRNNYSHSSEACSSYDYKIPDVIPDITPHAIPDVML